MLYLSIISDRQPADFDNVFSFIILNVKHNRSIEIYIISPLQGKGKGKGKARSACQTEEQNLKQDSKPSETVPKLRCLDVFAGCGGKFQIKFLQNWKRFE